MLTRTAQAAWEGNLQSGKGQFHSQSGAIAGAYSFASRFENAGGTNPEELIAAAHAACFSMALSAMLSAAGHIPRRVETTATVTVDKVDGGFGITKIALQTVADVPGIDDAAFQQQAQAAKTGCPVSQALAAVPEITLDARLVS